MITAIKAERIFMHKLPGVENVIFAPPLVGGRYYYC